MTPNERCFRASAAWIQEQQRGQPGKGMEGGRGGRGLGELLHAPDAEQHFYVLALVAPEILAELDRIRGED